MQRLQTIFGTALTANMPQVVYQNGVTDYLDQVPLELFAGQALIRGYCQRTQRPAVSVHLRLLDNAEVVIDHGIYTVFQRYNDSDKLCLCPSHQAYPQLNNVILQLLQCDTVVTDNTALQLNTLCTSGRLTGSVDVWDAAINDTVPTRFTLELTVPVVN